MPTNTPWYWKRRRADGKTNYEHYQWTKKRIEYRSKLNQENRKRGDYGNWDGKDLAHVDNNPKNFSKKNLRKQPAAVIGKLEQLKQIGKRRKVILYTYRLTYEKAYFWWH